MTAAYSVWGNMGGQAYAMPVVTLTPIDAANQDYPLVWDPVNQALNWFPATFDIPSLAAVFPGNVSSLSGLIGAGVTPTSGINAALQTKDGLKFPATQISSTDPNVLDAYAEGTFTPVVSGTTVAGAGTYTTQLGKYTRIGNTVFFQIAITITAHTGTGNIAITGLPFAAANDGNAAALAVVSQNLALTAGSIAVALTTQNSTALNVQQSPTGGGALVAIPMDTAFTVNISGTYSV